MDARPSWHAYWSDLTICAMLDSAVVRFPGKDAIVAYRADRDGPVRLTYRELGARVDRAAGSLRALGVGRGDVVGVQLPNWWEFVVAALACARLGAAVSPLMPIFRERELRMMLAQSEAKVLIVPAVFRGFDHAAMAQALRPTLPALRHVFVVDGDGPEAFDSLLTNRAVVAVPSGQAIGPDDMALLMFTSGTTGEPKGVMHTCKALVACTDSLANGFHLDAHDVLLCATPLGHMAGFAALMLQALRLGATLVLQDVWEGRLGVAIMQAEGVTHMVASTPFLADICDAVAGGMARPERLRTFLCGGAPIPPVLIERAAREVKLAVSSQYGCTETLSTALTEPERSSEKSASTDGRTLPGVEIRITDDTGRALPVGQTGRLKVRGAQMFVGYYKRPDLAAFDSEGWFDTGDLAYMDDEGYIRINGRTKDVLIRGGENIPVVEIENLLHRHPAVEAAAIVGYPDTRLGERACAFVVLRPGASLDLAAVQSYMDECRVAKQYWPERVEQIDRMPRTASGKVRKFALKELLGKLG
ncbi:MAG: AMP-binding protein [Pseudomonadota bacterium]